MELRKIRAVAAAAPFAAVVILELALQWLPGGIAGRTRFVLEGIVFVALAVYGAVMLGVTGTMRDRLKRQNRELLALHEAGLDVVSELSLEIVLKKVVDQARHLVGAKYGALSVVGDDGAVRSFVTSGITPEQREAIGPPPVGHGVLGVVLREGQRLRLEDIARHPRSVGFPAHHPMMKSLLAVPVTCKSPFLGNLYLAEKEGRQTFTSDEEETLERFAVQAALAIDNAYLHQQVGDLAVAQERLHIAHEMHDGIAQVLGYVNTKVQAANEYLRRGRSDEAAGQLRELASAAREAYSDVREAIVDLRTLPHPARAFADVLGEYVDRWEEQTGVSTHLSIDDDLALPAGIELQLIRIVQESLANVRKHAEAASVELAIHHRTGQLVLTVADDGLGFNPALRIPGQFPKFGLPTMRERAESIGGRLDIESAAGRGTIIRLEVPVPTE
ncbi:MAG: GAF domain-containing sensor histidine kinase [Acidobacteriota bacterium]